MIDQAYGEKEITEFQAHLKAMVGLAASVMVMCNLDGLPFAKYHQEIALIKPRI